MSARVLAEAFEKALRARVQKEDFELEKPLPTTRKFAQEYGVSNTTVAKLLKGMVDEDLLWQHVNGRYFLPAARAVLRDGKPIACLVRDAASWMEECRAIVHGAEQAAAANRTAMLMWRCEELVQQERVDATPVFGGKEVQMEALSAFGEQYAEEVSATLFEHKWLDEALLHFPELLRKAVIVGRETDLKGVGSVVPDRKASALMGLTHALARGYERMILVSPFIEDSSIEDKIKDIFEAAQSCGASQLEEEVVDVGTKEKRAQLLESLGGAKKKTLIYALEDNSAMFLLHEANKFGLSVPDRVGFLSAMGSSVAKRFGMSSAAVSLEEMGRRGIEMLRGRYMKREVVEASLFQGETT